MQSPPPIWTAGNSRQAWLLSVLLVAGCGGAWDRPSQARIGADVESIYSREGNHVVTLEVDSAAVRTRDQERIASVEIVVTLKKPLVMSNRSADPGDLRIRMRLQYNKPASGGDWKLVGETAPRRAAGRSN